MSSSRYLRNLPTTTACSEARPRSRTSKRTSRSDVELDGQEIGRLAWTAQLGASDRCGRVGSENLDVLQSVLEEGRIAAIDLKDVLLIDEDAVKLLIAAQPTESNSETARLISVNG